MREIGKLEMKLKEVKKGVGYYNVRVEVLGKKVKFLLPRYHPFLGWIEIFGLPPQHEWCVLKQLEPMRERAILEVGNKRYEESLNFQPYPEGEMNFISIFRKEIGGKTFEHFHWVEDYSGAPKEVIEHGLFQHDDGIYVYTLEKGVVKEVKGKLQKEFVDQVVKEHGETSQIWLKKFGCMGKVPPVYYQLFPTLEVLSKRELERCKGWGLEIGYLVKEGEELDKVHGNWYKLFKIGDKLFYVEESSYGSRKVDGVLWKNTYCERLYIR